MGDVLLAWVDVLMLADTTLDADHADEVLDAHEVVSVAGVQISSVASTSGNRTSRLAASAALGAQVRPRRQFGRSDRRDGQLIRQRLHHCRIMRIDHNRGVSSPRSASHHALVDNGVEAGPE